MNDGSFFKGVWWERSEVIEAVEIRRKGLKATRFEFFFEATNF